MYSDVELVKSRVNIVDVVGEYVKLTKAGNNFKACCPFHQEKTPSFNVNEEKQFYHCFGCGVGGDVFSFIMEIENIGFRESLELLAEKAGVELQNNFAQNSQSQDKKKQMYNALELATKFYQKQLWSGVKSKNVLKYLRERGLSDEIIKKFRLGYAPEGWENVKNFLREKGFPEDIGTQTGLTVRNDSGREYDRFRNRIMFPITDTMNRTIGFTSRVLPGADESQAKYVNTPETYLYHKSNILYGLSHAKQAIKQKDQVIIVEGNMDVIAAHNVGLEHTIAVSGTAMTKEHIHILKRYTNNFILFFDADDAGKTAARRSALLCLGGDVQVSMILLIQGKDAADIAKDNPKLLREIVDNAKNVIDVSIDMAKEIYDIGDPHGKRQAIEYVAEVISHMTNEIERNEWIRYCAKAFDVSERVVTNTVNNLMEQNDKVKQKSTNLLDGEIIKKQQSQMQRIYKSIILMMMAYPHVWEYVYKNKDKYGQVLDQKHIIALMREGPECNFSIGEFVKKDIGREVLYRAAMKMQQQYEIEHEDGGSPIEDTETYIAIATENFNKKRLKQLTQMMEEAETNGDYDKQKKLLEQISKLSQQNNK